MDKKIKTIAGYNWRIKSVQRFGYIIERVDNTNDVRWTSVIGWEEADEAIS